MKLEQQLAKLAELGFKLEDRISLDDILHSFDRKQYERMNIVKEREGHRFYVKDEGQAMLLFYLDSRKVADLNRLTNNALKPVLAQVENAINDEYEVLSALLNETYLTGDYKSIVITNPTCCEVEDGYVRSGAFKMYLDQLDPVSSETLDDYAARNKNSLTFEKKFNLKTKYEIVPYAEVERHFPQGMPEEGWKLFYSKYPGANGYIRLSRVGFNKARDQAIVNTAWMRGPLYGEGSYVLLGNQNGSWKVLKRVTTWVS